MNDYVNQLFKHYKRKGILIDTNILLAWCVGTVNRSRISEFNRTEKFSPKDYDTILEVLEYFNKTVTTPNILTEVNSLVNQIGDPEGSQCVQSLGEGITKLDEFYIESATVGRSDDFKEFGLTDCGIIEVSRDKYLVLTDDFKLANSLNHMGIDTINFNHLRSL